MRKSLLFLLLATVSVPAFAAPDDANDRAARREAARAEKADARAERQAEKSQPPQRPEPQAQVRMVEPNAINRPAPNQPNQPPNQVIQQQQFIDRRSGQNFGAAPPRPTLEQRRAPVDSVRDWRARERNAPAVIEPRNSAARDAMQQRRDQRLEMRNAPGDRRPPIISRVPREGTQPPPPPTSTRPSSQTAQHWNSNWRSNNHYDWQNHRRHHQSLFHLGFYYDPFGWGYRPYSIGWRLWPSYYQSSYWLNDPWMYRLPYAPPGYRWIRYYDDALLIDMWDGEVADVIYDFFW